MRAGEPGRDRDGFEAGKAPGGDVDELDLVPATAPAPVQLLRLRDPSGPPCGGDAGRPLLQVRTAATLDDPAARLRELLQQLFRERHTILRGGAGLSSGGGSRRRSGGARRRPGLGLPRGRLTGGVRTVSQVVPAGARQDDAPLPGFPGDLDQAPVLQRLAGGLVGAGLPYAGRAPGPHPLQHRKLTFVDLPLQWPAFDWWLTFDERMLSALAVDDGRFATGFARRSRCDLRREWRPRPPTASGVASRAARRSGPGDEAALVAPLSALEPPCCRGARKVVALLEDEPGRGLPCRPHPLGGVVDGRPGARLVVGPVDVDDENRIDPVTAAGIGQVRSSLPAAAPGARQWGR